MKSNLSVGKWKKSKIPHPWSIKKTTCVISRIQKPYKMAKFDKQSNLAKNTFSCMTLLHAHAQYIYIVCAKYQKISVKALVQVDFPVYELSKQQQNPYLIANRKRKKEAKFTKLSFSHKILSGIKHLNATVFNVSTLCRQSIKLCQQKLWYKLISPYMNYLCTCHTKWLSLISSHFAKK